METISKEVALDWELDDAVIEARTRLRDVEGIHEQRQREGQLLWDHKFSDDPFARARHRAEWPQAQVAVAQAEQYVLQAKTRLVAAEQAAKQRAQPVWDEQFRERWTAIDTVLQGPLREAIREWERLTADASAKTMTVPVALPNLLALDSMDTWMLWIRNQLGIEQE